MNSIKIINFKLRTCSA